MLNQTVKRSTATASGGSAGIGGMARFGCGQIWLAPEGDAGGGAGGATGNGATGGAAGGQQSIDQMNSAITSQLNRAIGKIQFGPMISEQIKNLMPDLTKSIVGAVVEQVSSSFDEKFKAIAPGQPGGGAGKDKPGAGAVPAEIQNALAQMQAQMKTLESTVAEKDKQLRTAAETQARKEEDDLLRNSLKSAGVSDTLLEGATAMLRQRGVVKRKDDGAIVVPVSRSQHGQQYTEELGVPAYISEWVKSTEGQSYLPARRVGGGGPGGQGNGRNQTQPGPGGTQQPGTRQARPGDPPRTADGKIDMRALDDQLGAQLLGLATGEAVDDVAG